VILGYCGLLELRLAADDSTRRMVEHIRDAGTLAATLTRQLLAFGRRQVLRPVVLNLNGLVTEMGTLLRRLIGENIEVATSLFPDLGYVKADPSQIEQILMNLAVNARDAMPSAFVGVVPQLREALLEEIGFENAPVQSKQGVQLTPLAAIQVEPNAANVALN